MNSALLELIEARNEPLGQLQQHFTGLKVNNGDNSVNRHVITYTSFSRSTWVDQFSREPRFLSLQSSSSWASSQDMPTLHILIAIQWVLKQSF